ncbi:MAG: hypothetical protein ACHQF3_08260 [Alphaproteobacteria bacterium]
MTPDLLAGVLGVLWYLALALLLAVSGLGVLAVTGCRERLGAPLLLAPAVMLALWAVLCSAAAWLRLPLVGVAPWVWGATLVLAMPGAWGLVQAVLTRKSARGERSGSAIQASFLGLAALCVLLPFAVVPGPLLFGLADFAGSSAPDSWSYVALADYLRFESRGAASGLSPLHQYAAHLANVRNASAALLAFLSPAAPGGRPDTALNLFCLLTLFAFAGAVASFGLTVFRQRKLPTVALLALTVPGWTGDIILAGNLDQLLALPLFPALASVAAHIGERRSFWRLTLLAALLIAAAFYTYTEIAALGVAVAASLWHDGRGRLWPGLGRAAASAALALAGAAVALLPVANSLVSFFLIQLAAGTGAANRPGEGYFAGLTDPHYALSAAWALGGEFSLADFSAPGMWISAILTGCALCGAVLLRRRPLALLGGAVVLVLYGIAVFRDGYSYAAYKIISVNFWMLAWWAVAGCTVLAQRLGSALAYVSKASSAAVGLALLLVPVICLRAGTAIDFNDFAATARAPHLSREAAEAAARIAKGSPVLVSVTDALANEWAVYQLSALPMRIVPYRSYMTQVHVLPLMAAARPVPWDDIAYVLTDRKRAAMPVAVAGGRILWQNPLYELWQVTAGDWATIADVDDANGGEMADRRPFLRLGGGPVHLKIVSAAAREAVLRAQVAPGPRAAPDAPAPDALAWQLAVTLGDWRSEVTLFPPSAHIRLPLHAGENDVTLAPLSAPSSHPPERGDQRPLTLIFSDYGIELPAR